MIPSYSTALMRRSFSRNKSKINLCCPDKNNYYFCKSSIPVIDIIVGSGNMIEVSK